MAAGKKKKKTFSVIVKMPSHLYKKAVVAKMKQQTLPEMMDKPKKTAKQKMPSKEELEKMTASQLRQHLKDMGQKVPGASKMKKADLVKVIDKIHKKM